MILLQKFPVQIALIGSVLFLHGCSYLKRGVNDRGRVANDVETEQIILDEEAGSCKGRMSSVVQMRGSIPLFWSQEASRFSPKPDIICKIYLVTLFAYSYASILLNKLVKSLFPSNFSAKV